MTPPPWDSYAHIGLHRGTSASALLAEMECCGIRRATLVPFLNAPGFDDLLQAAEEQPDRFCAVCRLDLDQPADQLSRSAASVLERGFRGARVVLPAPGDDEAAMSAILHAIESQDKVLVAHAPGGQGVHAGQIAGWLARYPRLRVFVPHLGWPRTAQGEATPGWLEGLALLAGQERVFFGLSALYFFSSRPLPFADTFDWVRAILDRCGPARCVLAGDYPMTLDRCSYGQVWESLRLAVNDGAAYEQMELRTPRRLWGGGEEGP